MDYRNEVADVYPYGVEVFLEFYVFYRVFDDGWVQLYERLYRATPLHVYGTPESNRPYGPLWEHHLPLFLNRDMQRLILGFCFHSEESMRSAISRRFLSQWDINFEGISDSDLEEPVYLED